MEQGNPLTATDGALVNFDAVCQRVRAAVEQALDTIRKQHASVVD